MKKIGKAIGIIIAGLLAILLIAFGIIFGISSSRLQKRYPATTGTEQFSLPTDPASIEEGKRLYISRGCVDCHGDNLAGKVFAEDPAIGRFAGSNLTLETNAFGIARAIRRGIGTDGRSLIFMPATDYQGLSDEDTARIISFIKSRPKMDQPSIPQSVGPVGRLLFVFGKLPLLASAEQISDQNKPPKRIQPTITIEFGHYISESCTGCHGSNLSGGPIPGAPPEWPPAQSITGEALSKWNERQFISAIRTGKRPDGSIMKAPMPWENFAHMSDIELQALWLYLKTTPKEGKKL
ncbi:cytochrome C [Leptospira broomii serovar Hurstbridge str. 5399]|uniref:Cytochrome C n=1 Tax=Leptospira broomii serovar Hurstbridge str. 5399 TaxID=1049789 RepID=T0GMX4_9LEPT|nr:c-type cytochrome [Leptospira broomii]EQA46693.1 cytochrome C [Leptospira broomii serovar Hurstbridge str. 5399]